tara:strand:- start:1708 stop:2346 length:639 start_codon:yes stop_codon:yes gene_type:complete
VKALQLEYPIDEHLKPVKDSDAVSTSMELSTTKLRVKDFEVTGTATGIVHEGMIIGYSRIQGDLTNQNSYEIQDTMTVEDSTHQITFKTPPSENVEIELNCFIDISTTDSKISIGLSKSDTYLTAGVSLEYDGGLYLSDDEAIDIVLTTKFVLDSSHLSPIGSSNTFYIGFSTSGATKTAYLKYGYRASHGLGLHPMIIKATALPSSIYDGN